MNSELIQLRKTTVENTSVGLIISKYIFSGARMQKCAALPKALHHQRSSHILGVTVTYTVPAVKSTAQKGKQQHLEREPRPQHLARVVANATKGRRQVRASAMKNGRTENMTMPSTIVGCIDG